MSTKSEAFSRGIAAGERRGASAGFTSQLFELGEQRVEVLDGAIQIHPEVDGDDCTGTVENDPAGTSGAAPLLGDAWRDDRSVEHLFHQQLGSGVGKDVCVREDFHELGVVLHGVDVRRAETGCAQLGHQLFEGPSRLMVGSELEHEAAALCANNRHAFLPDNLAALAVHLAAGIDAVLGRGDDQATVAAIHVRRVGGGRCSDGQNEFHLGLSGWLLILPNIQ